MEITLPNVLVKAGLTCPAEFWVSLRSELSQPLWETWPLFNYSHWDFFSPLSNLNVPFGCLSYLLSFCCVASGRVSPVFSTTTPYVTEDNSEISPYPSLPQAQQSQFCQSHFMCLVLQPLEHLAGRLLDSLPFISLSLVPGDPKTDTLFHRRSHECQGEEKSHFLWPAGFTLPNTAQYADGPLLPQGTLLTCPPCCKPGLPAPFLASHHQASWLRPGLLHGVNSAQMQDLNFPFVELQEFPHGPFLQLAEVLLNGSAVLQHIDHSPQFDIICRFAESAL